MNRKLIIEWNWNLSDYPNLTKDKKMELKQEAENRVFSQRAEGYTSGELHYEDEDISVWGWFESHYEEVNF